MYVNILFKKYNKQHTTLNYLTAIQLYTSTIQHSLSIIPPITYIHIS